MKRVITAAAIAVTLVGCVSSLRSKPVDDTVIDHLAMTRCMVMTNFGDRSFVQFMTEQQLKAYQKAGDKKSTDQLTHALYLMKNGGSKSVYERVMENWQSKDCKSSLITSMVTNFPEPKGAQFTAVMMADGFFDDGREKLSKPIYQLCSEDYKGMCD